MRRSLYSSHTRLNRRSAHSISRSPRGWDVRAYSNTRWTTRSTSLACYFYSPNTSGIIVLFHSPARAIVSIFAPVGQMALTNYVLQSLLIAFVSYQSFGGPALAGRAGPASLLTIALLAFSVQIVMSHFRLKRFAFGPLEWCWRALTSAIDHHWYVARRRPSLYPTIRPLPCPTRIIHFFVSNTSHHMPSRLQHSR